MPRRSEWNLHGYPLNVEKFRKHVRSQTFQKTLRSRFVLQGRQWVQKRGTKLPKKEHLCRLLPKQRWQQVQITLINGHQLWPILGTTLFQCALIQGGKTMLDAKKRLSHDRSKISWTILWSLWQKTKMMKMNWRKGLNGPRFMTFVELGWERGG